MNLKLIETCLAMMTTFTKHDTTPTSISHFVSMGCTFWFTGPNNDIPAATWGYATLVGLSGGPSSTIPCAKFLSDVVKIPSTDLISDDSSAATSEPSTTVLTKATPYVITGHDSDPPNVDHESTFTSSAYTGPRPTFRASDITGCYAMTGLGTTTYVTTTQTSVTTGENIPTGLGYKIVDVPFTTSMACSHFMTLYGPEIPYELLTNFARSPVCSSYVSWAKDHPAVPTNVYPPGVFNFDVMGEWNCGGKCYMNAGSMSVMYFETRSYDGCSAIRSTTSADPSVTKYAIVDGSTL